MDKQIIFTPAGLIAGFLGLCAAIATIGKALEWAGKGFRTLRKPEVEQNEKIKNHEERIKRLEDEFSSTTERHEQYFLNDQKKLEEITEGIQILLQVSFATLSHAINGNDIENLKKMETNLKEYLIKKES